jgi:hypothetical protein
VNFVRRHRITSPAVCASTARIKSIKTACNMVYCVDAEDGVTTGLEIYLLRYCVTICLSCVTLSPRASTCPIGEIEHVPSDVQDPKNLEVRLSPNRDGQRLPRLNSVIFFSKERRQDCAMHPKCAGEHTISSRNHRNSLKLSALRPCKRTPTLAFRYHQKNVANSCFLT